MSDLFWLADVQMERLALQFLKAHDKPCVDDRRVVSGIIFSIRNGLRWRAAPTAYGLTRRFTAVGGVGAERAFSLV